MVTQTECRSCRPYEFTMAIKNIMKNTVSAITFLECHTVPQGICRGYSFALQCGNVISTAVTQWHTKLPKSQLAWHASSCSLTGHHGWSLLQMILWDILHVTQESKGVLRHQIAILLELQPKMWSLWSSVKMHYKSYSRNVSGKSGVTEPHQW